MKKIIISILIVLHCYALKANRESVVDSNIQNITVYQQGAEVQRQATIMLNKGNTTLFFKGLSAKLDNNSIQAKGNNDLMIISVSHSMDYVSTANASKEIKKLERSKLIIIDSIALIKGLVSVYEQERDLILANKSIGGDQGVDVEELKSAASFLRSRLVDIEQNTRKLKKLDQGLKLKLVVTSKQLLDLNAKVDLPTSIVKVVVNAKSAMEHIINLTYIVQEAGWVPNYDLRIADVDRSINLTYKAKVFQNTDEDWNDVRLILSTGNPSISNYKPELSTYYLTFNNYYKKSASNSYENKTPFRGVVQGVITDAETGEVLPGTNVIVKGTMQGTVSDINGAYEINMPWDKQVLVYKFVGYKDQEKKVNSGIINVALETDLMELDEVVVTALGISSITGRVAGVNANSYSKPVKKQLVPLGIEKRQTSTEFEIDIPYTIPSDNKYYDVKMVEYEVPATYQYGAVPKLSDDTYLTAMIPDWTQYEMISGNANLFFQGIYQGETFLDLKEFDDTLAISVGRDQDIAISRELQKDYSKKSMLGSSVKELKSWEITIKNNKNKSILLEVEDQFPISKEGEIKVEQMEFTGAQLNEDDGKLIWNLSLKPKEKKTLIVKYEVKYPKYRKLIVE